MGKRRGGCESAQVKALSVPLIRSAFALCHHPNMSNDDTPVPVFPPKNYRETFQVGHHLIFTFFSYVDFHQKRAVTSQFTE